MKKYNCLIVGCGAQGAGVGQENNPNKIINFAHALTEHKGFGLIEFYDKDKQEACNAARKWNTCYINDLTYVSKGTYDLAIITTPDNEHYEVLKQLAEYPLKLVICEKPICIDLQQAREIVELYKSKGIPLMVNYTRRFLPYYDYLKQYGTPKYAYCNFNRGWIHSVTHAIDFFNMINVKKYNVKEVNFSKRIWTLNVFYDDYTFRESRFGYDPVWDYYDKSHMHVINNAYEFLEGREKIKCTGEMALAALEKCYELMNG